MNLRAISRNVGYALLVSSLFMFLSAAVSFFKGNDSALSALLISFTITFIVGVFPFIFVRKNSTITLSEGYVIISLSWLLSFIFGMLPYALWGGPFTLENAWFESVSGYTTTGATILSDVESLPDSLQFWRASTHFIGGLGVVVFLLLIIPNSSPVRMRLTNMELSSLSRGTYSSRAGKTVYIFAYVYLGLTLAATVSYLLAGMKPLDAVCHAMSVCATGGFSTRNASVASFSSTSVELITMLFMFLSSIHFGIIYLTIVTCSIKPLRNPVLRFYLMFILVTSTVVCLTLKFSGSVSDSWQAIRIGCFQTMSVVSTTGFAIADNASWSMLPCAVLMIAGMVCGCAGSTSGGLKVDRVMVLFKTIRCRIGVMLHPSSVQEVKFGKKILSETEVLPHIAYITLSIIIICVSILLALALGADPQSAISGSLSSVFNVGPGLGTIGTMGSYDSLNSGVKLLYTLDMFIGRVEIYPVIAVVAMIFERSRK